MSRIKSHLQGLLLGLTIALASTASAIISGGIVAHNHSGGGSGGTDIAAVPIGTVLDYSGTSVPALFKAADGSQVSRTACAKYFAAVGTAWGPGDGSTTVNLPDLRGRVTAGKDDMGGVAANRLTNANAGFIGTTIGAAGGDERMFAHSHVGGAHSHTIQGGSGIFALLNNGGGNTYQTAAGAQSNTVVLTTATDSGGAVATSTTGAGTAQNVQPTAIVYKIVKVDC